MRWRWFLPALSIFSGPAPAALAASPPGKVEILDGIVAVVDSTPILLSELRSRAKPLMRQLDAAGPKTGPARAAVEAQLHREVLGKMIDWLLFADAAAKARVGVDLAEVDAALQTVASSQGLTLSQLMAAAKEAGFSEKEYREEIRRQILQAKMVQLRIKPRIKGYESLPEPARAPRLDEEQRKWLTEQRAAHFIEVRL